MVGHRLIAQINEFSVGHHMGHPQLCQLGHIACFPRRPGGHIPRRGGINHLAIDHQLARLHRAHSLIQRINHGSARVNHQAGRIHVCHIPSRLRRLHLPDKGGLRERS